MRSIRRSAERGRARSDWLDSRHTFSFADYYDPAHIGFRALRVINEDWIAPSMGFAAHPHRDMEILTYPIEGAVTHRDSEGNVSTLRAGHVQLMRAGTGIMHSEMNALDDQTTRMLQIWIQTDQRALPPRYQEARLDLEPGVRVPVASKDGLRGGLEIHQDVTITAIKIGPRDKITQVICPERYAWLQIVSGSGMAWDLTLEAGDGLAVSEESEIVVRSRSGMEILIFDLA